MPPRVPASASHLTRPTPSSPPSICLRCLLQSRSISSSPSHQMRMIVKKPTRAQRAMRSWLNGPGAAFLQPVPGSTNYLGAYDKSGTLIRGRAGASGDTDEDGGPSSRRNKDEDQNDEEDGNEDKEKRDVEAKSDEPGNAEESGEGKSDDKNKMPPETVEDLRPFPLNPFFRSEPVLSEAFRNEIHRRVGDQGQTVREVSVSMNVTMERVAAVYRMKEMEKRRMAENKPLYLKYQQIVMGMLPQTKFDSSAKSNPRHENINDLPVHPSTLIQMFHPTTESRHFTRVDAGRIFHPDLKPADARIPHPEMIDAARDLTEGYNQSERTTRMKERYTKMEEEIKEKGRRKKATEARRTTTIEGKRWDFKFRDVSADVVGKDGRSRTAVGWRYGQPFEDRKKGQVKIPTRVD